tara:strand:+ start:4178 stop:4582 length:405 start_codon:yes stop_codon:yes gene_type:complete
MNQLSGTIKVIGETTQYGPTFQKREFVVTTQDKFPQDIKLELYQDDCGILDDYSVGNVITASYNLKGNEYKGKYYVNLQAWKLEEPQGESESAAPAAEKPAPKKRGRPRKNPEPQIETTEDLAEDVEELADAPF